MQKLTTLELSWNQIGNEGGQRLGAALQLNKVRKVLFKYLKLKLLLFDIDIDYT
jgi:hypothetical protein